MLTEEQIKNLKKGDPVIIHGTFDAVDADGDICIKSTVTHCGHTYRDSIKCAHPSCVSLSPEKPKYDPCRKFKKGDRVQVVKCNGRCNGKAGEYLREAFCEVAEDEVLNERVRVYHNSSEYRLDPAYLKLDTPVDELEPYSVEAHEEGECGCFEVMRGEQCVSIYPYGTHETRYYKKAAHAKEAAEAECDRLNAEWRKEKSYNQNQH